MKRQIASKELQSLFNSEWKRAKRIGKPFFDNIEKPRLYTINSLWKIGDSNWIGIHAGNNMTWGHKINGRWIRASHIITLRDDLQGKQLLDTIRHEIVHTVHQDHKRKFKMLLAGLTRETEKTAPTVLPVLRTTIAQN